MKKSLESLSRKTLIDFSKDYIDYLKILLDNLDHQALNSCFEVLESARIKKNKIFIIGNGGSASTASHIGNDFGLASLKTSHKKKSIPYKIISLTDNNAIISALGNDNGFDNIFVEQLKVLFEKGDVLISISASGNSKNLIKACEWVNENDGTTIGWLGFDGGKLKNICNQSIIINSPIGEYAPVEDIHLIINHIIVTWMHSYLIK